VLFYSETIAINVTVFFHHRLHRHLQCRTGAAIGWYFVYRWPAR